MERFTGQRSTGEIEMENFKLPEYDVLEGMTTNPLFSMFIKAGAVLGQETPEIASGELYIAVDDFHHTVVVTAKCDYGARFSFALTVAETKMLSKLLGVVGDLVFSGDDVWHGKEYK